MKKAWWEYLNTPAYMLVFGGVLLLKKNFTAGVICMVLGILTTGTYFFMKMKNS
ncbi:MAG TPA: hypothetical protein VIN07_06430 [Flavipsychrobacter sp.]